MLMRDMIISLRDFLRNDQHILAIATFFQKLLIKLGAEQFADSVGRFNRRIDINMANMDTFDR